MASLASRLSDIVRPVFADMGADPACGTVKISDRADLAAFQCNGAMGAAKTLKRNPREIASAIVEKLQDHEAISKIDIAGPGFINIDISDDFLTAYLDDLKNAPHALIPQTGEKQTAVLDYGGPNIAKAMHVGHFRPAVVGDSIRRIMKAIGFETLGDVHLGDWGTPMGMIIAELETRHPDWPYFDENHKGDYPAESPVTIDDLEEIYPAASRKAKEDPAEMERARQATLALQDGRPGYRALWQHFFDVSMDSVKENYRRLGVHFDLWKGESDVHDYIAPMVEDMLAKGIAEKSDGATIVPVAKEDDKHDVPPLILYKSDGAVLYGTTDCATILERVKLYNPSRIIYVVDQRQHLHFEQVFRASYKSGVAPEALELTHAGFGTMNGPDGKPFKTRDGNLLRLNDFISMTQDKARSRLNEAALAQDMSDEEREDVAQKVAMAAIKFADLLNPRQSDYVFDLDRFVNFEGKTGPYLLYQAVRIKSILRKAEEQNFKPAATITIQGPDRALALILGELPDAFSGALNNYAPHYVADYAYRLAREFSRFYNQCHIMTEKDESVRDSYLALLQLSYDVLALCIDTLGITVPDRM